MQLKMNDVQLPEKVSFNYEELKQEIAEKASFYANLVFTENQMQEAKSTRADLNKLKKALNDERLRQEKEYMKPFNEFKAQINEIISLIDEPVKVIDSQIKGFEARQKEEKMEKLTEFWNGCNHPEWLELGNLFDPRWLNASVAMKTVQTAINEKLTDIESDIATLSTLPEFSFEAVEVYKKTLDLNKAISEGQRLADIQKRKMEAEAAKMKVAEEQPKVVATANVDGENITLAEIPVEIPPKQWVKFAALLSTEDAKALKQFCEDRKIEIKAI